MGAGISSLPPPVFVDDADGLDPNLILADMIAEFEAAAGRVLYPAQVERLLINLYAYRESLVRNAIQYAAQQNLLAFASFTIAAGTLVGTNDGQFTFATSATIILAAGATISSVAATATAPGADANGY